MPRPLALSDQEKAEVLAAAKEAAVCVANFWDVLAAIEGAHGVEFDGSMDVLSTLAGACEVPASVADLEDITADEVIDQLDIIGEDDDEEGA